MQIQQNGHWSMLLSWTSRDSVFNTLYHVAVIRFTWAKAKLFFLSYWFSERMVTVPVAVRWESGMFECCEQFSAGLLKTVLWELLRELTLLLSGRGKALLNLCFFSDFQEALNLSDLKKVIWQAEDCISWSVGRAFNFSSQLVSPADLQDAVTVFFFESQ